MQFLNWLLSLVFPKQAFAQSVSIPITPVLTVDDVLFQLCDSIKLDRTPIRRLLQYNQVFNGKKNLRYWVVADMSVHSAKERFHVFDVVSRSVQSIHVAHGKNSDPSFTGKCQKFSNVPGSLCTSKGIYKAAEEYTSTKFGKAMRLDGMEETNSNARKRAVVFHGAVYAAAAYIKSMGKCGRSEGCLAVAFIFVQDLIQKLKGGSLIYVWAGDTDPVPRTEKPMAPEFEERAYKADWDHLATGKAWTKILSDALDQHGQAMLRMASVKDASKWCPKFASLSYEQRKQFFVMLISSMARFESSFDKWATYKESFSDNSGSNVISRGLLQISQESANSRRYQGNITDSGELHDVATNLITGVKILNYWIPNDGVIGTGKNGGGRYWSVMRDSSGSQAKIKAKVLGLSF